MGKYASFKRVERLEVELENVKKALESQTALLIDIRSKLVPVPVEVVAREQAYRSVSRAVRNANASA